VSSRRRSRSARARRRERERQEDAQYRRLLARARKLSFEPEELDEAIGQQPRLLDVVLTSRYAARCAVFGRCPKLLPTQGRTALALIPAADAVLTRARAGWSPAPDLRGRPTWPDMLRWGLDKAADTCRLLRAGLTFGALALARAQLERWTLNVAAHHRVPAITDTESEADYIRRVWSVYPQISESIDLGLAWRELSEWLHGRGSIATALSEIGDAASIARPGTPAGRGSAGSPPADQKLTAVLDIHARAATVIEIVMRQVRGGVSLLAEELYGDKFTPALQLTPSPDEKHGTEPTDLALLLGALDYNRVFGELGKQAIRAALAYRAFVDHDGTTDLLASGISPGLTIGAMLERRGRAVQRARDAFAAEQESLGEEFDPQSLEWRLFQNIAIGEAAYLAAEWAADHEADALRAAAAALQSAWWLWLEDTDDAMTCVRGVLEQTCRARAHRIKPARAARMEDIGAAASTARWLETAGRKRLAVLGQALGEFAHISFRVRWSGARDALAALQTDDIARPDSTARRHALEMSAYLLGHEVAARFDAACPAVGAAFRARVTQLGADEHERQIEELLRRSLMLRGTDFGQPDLRPLSPSGAGA
jgi:hypothetical protein